RQLYPGITYQSPPPQDKLNPLEVTKDDFFAKIPDDFNGYCYNSLLYNFRGIGPNMAREITYRAKIDFEKAYNTLSIEEKNALWQSFRRLFSRVDQGDYNPTIGLDGNGNVDYFSAFPLTFKEIDEEDLIYFVNTGELFDYYYENHIKRRHFIRYSRRLKDTIENYLKKNRKKQYELRQRLKASLNAEKYKKKGELITANIYRLEPGESEIEVEDYYSEDNETIKIKLDPDLSPSDNAQKYFRKYEKAKKSKKYLKHELGKFRHEERYLENVQHNIEQAETEAELAEIEKELKEEGYIQEQKAGKNSDNKPLPPHKFKSSGGYDILVGRNNHQNDELTTQMANPQDLWLHTKEIAGSHVIVRNHTREDSIPDKTIEEAARLAAYFSKARMSENVPIDYTRVKNVNKPRGAKPGLAYYEEYQTVYVDPMEEDKIRELKVTQDN
ncbi:MAG: Rqc2 family fibronectin-binding protein, partial [Halanaerobiales bacterium]